MALYEWICKDCNIYWDAEHPMGEAPKQTECPKCGTLGNRYWQSEGCAISFKDDGMGNHGTGAQDFSTVRRRYEKFHEKGYDKDSANRFLHGEIRKTKEAMDDEAFRYKSAQIDYDKYAKAHGLKKVSDKEAHQKQENARKLTIEAYDRANRMGYKDIGSTHLDPAKPNKNK